MRAPVTGALELFRVAVVEQELAIDDAHELEGQLRGQAADDADPLNSR